MSSTKKYFRFWLVLQQKYREKFERREKINRLLLVFFVSFFVFGTFLGSQSDSLKSEIFVKQFSLEQGLMQSMVTCIHRDKSGLLWVGTGSGLHYFDGIQFHAVQLYSDENKIFPSSIIRDISEWDKENLLLTSSTFVGIFNKEKSTLKVLCTPKKSEPIPLKINYAQKRLFWSLEEYFFWINQDGIFPGNFQWEKEIFDERILEPKQAFFLKNEQILMGGHGWIAELNPKENFGFSWFSFYDFWPVLAKSPNDEMYIAGNGKIEHYKKDGKAVQKYHTGIQQSSMFFIDKENAFWISDKKDNQLYRFKNGVREKINITVKEGRWTDTITPYIKFMEQDEKGNIWIGTDGAGLLLYQPNNFDFSRALIGFTSAISASENYIWAGTYKNGLWKLSPNLKDRKKVVFPKINDVAHILDVICDKYNRIWVASEKGITVFSEDGKEVVFPGNEKNPELNNLSKGRWLQIHEDTIAFSMPRSYDFKSWGAVYYFTCTPEIKFIRTEKTDTYITSIFKNEQEWWLGGKEGLYKSQTLKINNENLLTSKSVNCLLKVENTIWVSGNDGINIFSEDGTLRKKYTYPEHLPTNKIYGIVEDYFGRVWFSSDYGIGCVLKNGKILLFGSEHNMQSLEFSSNAFYQTKTGEIYFGGIAGINGFLPEKLNESGKETAENVPILLQLNIADSLYCKGIPKNGTNYVINQNNTMISGVVGSTDYVFSTTHHFSFMLKNHQDKWSSPSKNRTYEYDNLPAGEYELLAKYQDVYGNWSNVASLLKITIPPLFYQTLWFRILLILAAIPAFVAGIKYYQKRKFRKIIFVMKQKNALNEERWRIARDMHDELGSGLAKMAVISQMLEKKSKVPDEIEKYGKVIKETSTKLMEDMGSLVWSLNSEHQAVQLFIAKLREYFTSYLGNLELTYKFSVTGKSSPKYQMGRNLVRNIYPACKEAVNNAVKHSKATEIRLEIHLNDAIVSFKISDNGKGFVQKDFLGNGLKNMEKRIFECKGEMEIKSEVDNGTTIIFKNIPLQKITEL